MAMMPLWSMIGHVPLNPDYNIKRAFYATMDRLLHPHLWEEVPQLSDIEGRPFFARTKKLEYPHD